MTNQPPTPVTDWVSMHHLRHLLTCGEAVGMPIPKLMVEIGLTYPDDADGDKPVPLTAIEQLLDGMRRHAPDVAPGLRFAEHIQPATYGVLGHLLQACDSYADVLNAMVRFNGLLSNVGETSLRYGPGTVQLCWNCVGGGTSFRRHATDYVLGVMLHLSRLALHAHYRGDFPLSVQIAFPAPRMPALRDEYAHYFGCPVSFDQSYSCLTFSEEVLACRMPYGDATIKALFEQHALSLLRSRQPQASITLQASEWVRRLLPTGQLSRDVLARKLAVSEPVLVKALREHGSSFRDLVEACRVAQIDTLIADDAHSDADLSVLLGFTSARAFQVWFRRRFMHSPSQHREQLQGVSNDD